MELRCPPCTITSEVEITPGIDLKHLKIEFLPRTINNLTPLEVYLKIYPEEKQNVINQLQPKESKAKIHSQ